jgi:FkbM family methyltransferase
MAAGPIRTVVGSIQRGLMSGVYARRGIRRTFAGQTFRWRYRYSRFDNFEPPVYAAFVERIRPGLTVLDVGAWVGLYSVTAAASGCSVYAFEPTPATRRLLIEHLRLNGLDATVVPAAMSDRDGETTLFAQRASGLASLSERAAGRVELVTGDRRLEAVTVPTVRFDGFCEAHGIVPDLVKLDVEGAEMRVLSAAGGFLSRRRGCLLIEAHPLALQEFGDSLEGLLDLLADAGWKARCIYRRGAHDNPDRTLHYLAEPELGVA